MAMRTAVKACGGVFTEATVLIYDAGRKAVRLYSQKLPSSRMLGVHRAHRRAHALLRMRGYGTALQGCKGGKMSRENCTAQVPLVASGCHTHQPFRGAHSFGPR